MVDQGEVPGAAFGVLLRRFRSRAGLTQEELAERAGISARAVSDLERGLRSRPYPETVRLLAGALELAEHDRAALLAAARPEAATTEPQSGKTEHQLPVPPTALVGRERELREIVGLLARSDVRLLTLTGPGGTGKTRLALAAATHLRDIGAESCPDGVAFVPLASLSDPALVPSAIAAALGIREDGEQPLQERLREGVAAKQVLVVLDNVEHLVSGVAFLVAELLAAAPGLRVLATSRVPLRLQGEQEYAVPPLGLPRRKPPPTPEQLSQYEAVRLFITRAQSVRADFTVDNETAPAVAEICHRLDGLPLAIELAAARVRMLPPQAMLTRLEQRLPFLTGGARDAPARQQTLRQAIAWSYDLLSPEEQALFPRLAVFAGGVTFDAAEEVGNPRDQLDIFSGLERLVEHSLLLQEAGPEGEPRFSMLETIREFGLEQLAASGEAEEMRQRHASFFLSLAEEVEPALHGPKQLAGLERLEAERDNLRLALGWSLAHDPDVALRLVAALWRFWYARGYLREGRDWLGRTLATSAGPKTVTRARALNALGVLVWTVGDLQLALELQNESLSLAQELGDQWGMAAAAGDRAMIEFFQDGDVARARAAIEDLLSQFRALGDRHSESLSLAALGGFAREQGELDESTRLLQEALEIARERGDSGIQVLCLNNLAQTARLSGELDQAAALLKEGLQLAHRLGAQDDIRGFLALMGSLAVAQGEHERGVRLLGAASALTEAVGAPLQPEEQTQFDEATATVREALSEAVFSQAWEAGRSLPVDEAMAEALVLTDEIGLSQQHEGDC
jgi:predicted ATPase/DNA-binding XRE family transcriptional regulator